MEKSSIKSAISIEYGLSREQSDRVVKSIFSNLSDYFIKNKKVEIQKFGKFKPVSAKSSDDSKEIKIKFIPSKKLANRINSNFEHLEKVKIRVDEAVINIAERIRDKAVDETTNQNKSTEVLTEEKNAPDTKPRKLLSEDLIKLHEEIVSETRDKKDVNVNSERKDDVNNLWR